jgi:phosphatidylinositol alpha-1,6-mannosyltransferase
VRHLLVTNDFPPKLGGIQSYLYELWRRLPPESFTVLTTPHPAAAAFDAAQPFPVRRVSAPMLWPTPGTVLQVRRLAARTGARLVVLDPGLPVGLIGPFLGLPYLVVLHGAEVTVPRRLPGLRRALRHVLVNSAGVIAAGSFPASEARRLAGEQLPPITVVPPGVDPSRFRPLAGDERARARARLGLPADARLVASVSRLVPRKGMDTLIDAAALLAPERPDLVVAIAGQGRDRARLERRIAATRAPVHLTGPVGEEDKALLYGAADVFALLCRSRWVGFEQEGFGAVFLEAAAAGVPQVAGRSGGTAEAVLDATTGVVVDRPSDARSSAAALAGLLDDPARRERLGAAARARVESDLNYDRLVDTLAGALAQGANGRRPAGR